MHGTFTFDKFKDNKGVSRRRKSIKNRQYNGQTKKDKQNNTRETKEEFEPPKNPGMTFGGEEKRMPLNRISFN